MASSLEIDGWVVSRYGKTKDAFGWPEETEEAVNTGSGPNTQALNTVTTDQETQQTNVTPLTKLEK